MCLPAASTWTVDPAHNSLHNLVLTSGVFRLEARLHHDAISEVALTRGEHLIFVSFLPLDEVLSFLKTELRIDLYVDVFAGSIVKVY